MYWVGLVRCLELGIPIPGKCRLFQAQLGLAPGVRLGRLVFAPEQLALVAIGNATPGQKTWYSVGDGNALMCLGNLGSQNTRGDKMASDDLGDNETALLNRVLDLTKWTILALLVVGGFLGPQVLGVI